jgi:hypothetical protein
MGRPSEYPQKLREPQTSINRGGRSPSMRRTQFPRPATASIGRRTPARNGQTRSGRTPIRAVCSRPLGPMPRALHAAHRISFGKVRPWDRTGIRKVAGWRAMAGNSP